MGNTEHVITLHLFLVTVLTVLFVPQFCNMVTVFTVCNIALCTSYTGYLIVVNL
uniref:Uncharacterized protein n=1 Tax=Arundo donax TaxID=35708 RepID=A0A0A9DV61_ARUDO